MRGCRVRDRKMAKDPHDSRRKNELVTGRHILIDIYEGYGEVRGKINRKSFKKGYQILSRRLYDRVIVRLWMENECHHHVKESRTFAEPK